MLIGSAAGALGFGRGCGQVTLREEAPGQTVLAWHYEASVGGKIAAVGSRLLDAAARLVIRQFFTALAARAGGRREGWFVRLWQRLRGGR
jgi:2-furoyl-CoA dehydrogenase large subunit